jgi:hypothetical protein
MRSMTSALAAGDDSGSKGGSSLFVAWRERCHLYEKKGRPKGSGVVRRKRYLTSFCKTSQSVTICVMSPA